MRTLASVAACLAVLAVCGCVGGKNEPAARPETPVPSPQSANWAYAPKALELVFQADPMVTASEGAGHALAVCVYQLEDPAAFRALAAAPGGLARLLECRPFDSGVVACQRLVVQPGRTETFTFDRNDKARFVAVACGYAALGPDEATRVFEIPVQANTSGWLWWKETTYAPGKLSRKILLGRTGVQSVGDGS